MIPTYPINTVERVLARARHLIFHPVRWQRGKDAMAVTSTGKPTGLLFAARWSIAGAIHAAAAQAAMENDGSIMFGAFDSDELAAAACETVAEHVPGGDIFVFNGDPETTHAAVLAAFDRALAADPVEVLRAARDRIGTAEQWTWQYMARDRFGDETEPEDDDAVCWCAHGAVSAAVYEMCGDFNTEAETRALALLRLHMPAAWDNVTVYNDDLGTHGEVMAWFNTAIDDAVSNA